jgi:hypothetical protein
MLFFVDYGGNMTRIKVTVICENCSRQYDYGFYVPDVGSVTSSYGNRELQKTVTSTHGITTDVHKKNAIKNAMATLTPCPDCGYIQSWMVIAFRRQQRIKGLFYFLEGVGVSIVLGLILLGINKLLGPFENTNSWNSITQIFVIGPIELGFIAMIAAFAGLLDFIINPNKKFKDPGKVREPIINFY